MANLILSDSVMSMIDMLNGEEFKTLVKSLHFYYKFGEMPKIPEDETMVIKIFNTEKKFLDYCRSKYEKTVANNKVKKQRKKKIDEIDTSLLDSELEDKIKKTYFR